MVSNLHKNLQKRGQNKLSGNMTVLIIGLIVVVMATAIAPDMFNNIAGLGADQINITNSSGETELVDNPTPDWVSTVLTLTVAAGLVFLVWNVFLRK